MRCVRGVAEVASPRAGPLALLSQCILVGSFAPVATARLDVLFLWWPERGTFT